MALNSTIPDKTMDDGTGYLPAPAELFSAGIHTYRAYGLTFSSEICFPQWPGFSVTGEADVSIRQGVIFGKNYTPPDSVQIESSPGHVLLRGSQSATIRVSGGNAITVEQLPGGNPAVVRQILSGWALAGIFHQRGMMPLHGSVICDGEACFVLCAESGIGKSTLAIAFLNAGHTYLDDNVALIHFGKDIPWVIPGIPEIRLWEDALQHVAFEHRVVGRVKPDVNKLALLSRANFKNEPVILKRIFILRRTQNPDISFVPLIGAAKFKVLWEHVFCVRFMGDSGNKFSLFQNLKKLASDIACFEIRLPAELPPPDKLREIIHDFNIMH